MPLGKKVVMGSIFKVGLIMSLVDRIRGPMRRIMVTAALTEKKFERVTRTIKGVGIALAALTAISAAGLFGFLRMADTAGLFQQELVATKNISSATRKEMRLLHDSALNLGVITEFSPLEAVKGFRSLAAVGLTVKEQLSTLPPVLSFATANQLEVAAAADTVTAALKGFNWEISRATEMADMLTKLTNVSAFRSWEIQQAVAGVASIGKAANQSASSVLALMGVLRNTGETGLGASDHVRMALTALLKPSRWARKMAKKFNVDLRSIYRDSAGNILPLLEVFARITEATKKLDAYNRNLLIGNMLGVGGLQAYMKAQYAVYTTTLNGVEVTYKGAEAVRAMEVGIKYAAGTVKLFAEAQRATWPGVKKMLRGTLETFVIAFGETLLPLLSKIIHTGTQVLNFFLRFVIAHKTLFSVIVPLAAILLAAGVAVGVTGLAFIVATWAAGKFGVSLKGAGAGLYRLRRELYASIAATRRWTKAQWAGIPSLNAITAAVWRFNVALLANPLTWWAVGLAAVTFVLYKLLGGFEGLGYIASSAWREIASAFAPLVSIIGKDFPQAIAFLSSLIPGTAADWKALWWTMQYTAGYVIGFVVRVLKWLASIAAHVLGGLYTILITPWKMAKAFLSGESLYDVGANLMGTFGAGIKSMLSVPYNLVKSGLLKVKNLLPGSDAREGPLSKLTASGAAVMRTMAAGVKLAAPDLKAAVAVGLSGVALAAAPVVNVAQAAQSAPIVQVSPAAAPDLKAAVAVSLSGAAPVAAPSTSKETIKEKFEVRTVERGGDTVNHFHINVQNIEELQDLIDFIKTKGKNV